jgi:hypothetical protein
MNMYTLDDEDPIVAEVRREREEYAAQFGYDMRLIDEDTKRRARVLQALFPPHDQAAENANMNNLADDPNVAEVRRIVEEYTTKFGYDTKPVNEDLKRRTRELRARFGLHDKADDRSNSAPAAALAST